jgi:signal transduction histidine kinase
VNEHAFAVTDDCFLVLAPTGRDAQLTLQLLERAGIEGRVCRSMRELCEVYTSGGAAGLMLAEEVLVGESMQQLGQLLVRQATWSDLPILLFTGEKATAGTRRPTAELLAQLGNVTLLDRPVRPITMLTTARAVLRARHRQYLMRDELGRQQRAVAERDQFLAMLGHELRNPLSAVLMAAGVLDNPDVDRARYLDILKRQAKNLARLVDDLLDVSRVTSGRIVLQKQKLDVGELLRRCLQAMGAQVAQHDVVVELAPTTQKLLVDGDPVRLEQVFVNLVNNALKYTPARGRIDIEATAEGEQVVVRVRDTGVGIAADMLARIFDMFVQVESTLDRAKGGLGIGLTLVRSLVQLHEGSVSAESAGVGAGSLFTVRLPQRRARSLDGIPVVAPPLELPTRTYDIVIVEDNPDSREVLSLILARSGHRVHAVGDGLAGVEAALERRPQLMVVDIGLPGLDGFGVARRVRQALGREVYLIALTGYGQPEDRRRALEAGFDAHLTKPVDASAIGQVLQRQSRAS